VPRPPPVCHGTGRVRVGIRVTTVP
jgi:hypothetical protein